MSTSTFIQAGRHLLSSLVTFSLATATGNVTINIHIYISTQRQDSEVSQKAALRAN